MCTRSTFQTIHFIFELQSPFIIPDLFAGRFLEAQAFCYADSAPANSCQDLVSQDNSAASQYIVEHSEQAHPNFFDPQFFSKAPKMLRNIQRRNWRVSAFPPPIPLTLTEVHRGGENILPLIFWGGQKVWALQVLLLGVAHLPRWRLLTPEMNFEIVNPTDLCKFIDWNCCLFKTMYWERFLKFFAATVMFLKAFECAEKCTLELLIFHHPVCVASDAS